MSRAAPAGAPRCKRGRRASRSSSCGWPASVYAYRPACPGCESLARAGPRWSGTALICAGCGNRYDVLRAGRCLDAPAGSTSSRCRCSVDDEGLVQDRPARAGLRRWAAWRRTAPDRGWRASRSAARARPSARRARGALRAVRRADRRPSTGTCSTSSSRELLCACRACSILFDRRGRERGPLPARRRPPAAPRRLRARRRRRGRSCGCRSRSRSSSTAAPTGACRRFYPSPMGPTESLLGARGVGGSSRPPTRCWRRWRPTSRRCWSTARAARARHWLVPIDECYALVGLIRTRWRGLTGGAEVWEEIGAFFDELDRRARPASRQRRNSEA